MTDQPSLIEFPCDFQIKIIGINHSLFLSEILNVARKHYPNLDPNALRTNTSQNGKYLAITLTVHALDQVSLDNLYRDLSALPDIKMVL